MVPKGNRKKVLVAMSGGVDSSVAVELLQRQGYDCYGATMQLYRNEEIGLEEASVCAADEKNSKSCCSWADMMDAARVAFGLGVPHEIWDYREDFRRNVMEDFVRVYEAGGTPNPCIQCNRTMKFRKMWEEAKKRGMDYLATGHYARIEYDDASGRWLLKKAVDASKDQSYVLYMLSQEQLAHTLFPLGGYHKTETRQLAEASGFVNANKQDSQDICFVPDGDYARFIEGFTGHSYPEGDFVDPEGNVLGRHKGIIRNTVGQRKGLGISSTAPLYVVEIRPEANQVVLSHGEGLFAKRVIAKDINLISKERLEEPLRCKARIRYYHSEQPCTLSQDGDRLIFDFDEPQRAPTVGQAVVAYDGDIVVGGGTICEVVH